MTILVTGGTKGIGLAIARRLASPTETMVLAYRSDREAAARAEAELAETGTRVETMAIDVGTINGAAALMARVEDFGEPLTCLVHNSAMIYPTTMLGADLTRFTWAVQTNGLSLLYLVSAAQRHLRSGSRIIFVSSAGARSAMPGYGAVGAAKALGESLIRYLVPELAPLGVTINGVAPGLVRTSSVAAMVGGEAAAEQRFERAARTNPSGRMSEDADFTEVVAFLASPAAAFVQGQVIHANGGAFIP